MTKLHELAELGQAIWLDYIRRSFITSGEFAALIDQGLRGVTSNPTILEKAIAGSADYDHDLRQLVAAGRSATAIYEALALEDIGRAADLLRPVYDRTDGLDGYVSLEVSPTLADDTAGTVAEARRLFATLGRPNVLIKVPATAEGIPAIATLISEGINVNVTLIFSLAHYDAVTAAYLAGLEQLVAHGGDPRGVASVASFFVSRLDAAVDRQLDDLIRSPQATLQPPISNTEYPISSIQPPTSNLRSLKGKTAIASAKLAYARFRETFRGQRWEKLAAQGARVQRPLWASTSTKNPLYPDTLYVDNLIGAHTVNTVPPATLTAFLDHGAVALTLEEGVDEAREHLARLADLGLDLEGITRKLQDDGVAAFAHSFEALLASIAEKRERLLAGEPRFSARLGQQQPAVDAALAALVEQRILPHIWEHDHTVWKEEPAGITNRLGWLHTVEAMQENLPCLEALADQVRADGITDVLLLGMGGSSLAPEVFSRVFADFRSLSDFGSLHLAVLDSTDPAAVLAHLERLDLARTLFIVATKSGTTAETLSFFKFFYNYTAVAVGADRAGAHFLAITDPGTPLADLAQRYGFRAAVLNDPNIGGRYSALSYFGLLPAALLGLDLRTLLERATTMACNCAGCNRPLNGDNHGAWLGAILGQMARAGRDKLTLVTSPTLASFGDWVEQLIAESTGKEGQGILPVVGEPLGPPDVYGDDRLFVTLDVGDWRLDVGDRQAPNTQYLISGLEEAGHPVVRLHLHDLYDLGGQFFLWQMATAVASHLLGVNPFDQPDVEAAKALARCMIAEYKEKGQLPRGEAAPLRGEALTRFLAQAQRGDYIALQAYVQPTAETDSALQTLRSGLRDGYRLATTVGYGPRFLHSTGQLHKGDRGNGLFIQLTADDLRDAPIPDQAGAPQSSITFGLLKAAQAEGDRQALLAAGRRVIRFHLGTDVLGGLKLLTEMV